jgi:hypothetical protein
VCIHPRRSEIEIAVAARSPYRTVSRLYGPSKTALLRHQKEHAPVGLIEAATTRKLREHEAFLAALEELHALTGGALAKAKEAGDLNAISRLVAASRGLIETAARLTGELRSGDSTTVNVVLAWPEGEAPAARRDSLPPSAVEARLVSSTPGAPALRLPDEETK